MWPPPWRPRLGFLSASLCLAQPKSKSTKRLAPAGRIGNPCDPWIILKTSHFVWSTGLPGHYYILTKFYYLENLGKYHFFRQLWLVLGVKLMEINSNLFFEVIHIATLFLLQTVSIKSAFSESKTNKAELRWQFEIPHAQQEVPVEVPTVASSSCFFRSVMAFRA